ncbi:MAG: ABC transporter substrate-binding protein [Bacilli bacterium]|nr:ABC transporter substrate-binding protein [Bacilli bacterium]
MNKSKLLLLVAAMLPVACGLTACNQAEEKSIGILQFGDFDALNKAREGFIDGLKKGGFGDYKIDYKNANADSPTNSTMAKGLASKNHALNLGIATPSATALKAALDNVGKDTPLLFTATTDPVDAGLLTNVNAPEGFVTGTSDLQPAEAMNEQIKLVKKMIPDAKKLGIFYCSSESNSQVQANAAKPIAEAEGLEVVIRTCVDQQSIKNEVAILANDVDAIWIPTDNTIANSIGKIREALTNKKVLLISGEEGMLSGMHVSVSITYYDLGLKTAELACEILNGKAINEIPVFYPTIDTCVHVYSEKNLTEDGFKVEDLPSEFTWRNID